MRFIPETTSDGSLSCRDSQTGELCHNRAGAYTEALEHYIRPSGLIETILRTGEARVLDACYGLGYNTWVLADAIVKSEALQSRSEPFTVTVSGVELSREVIGFLPRVLELPTFVS